MYKVDFPNGLVWSFGRTATRVRVAVCRMRTRGTMPRMRTRISGLGLQTMSLGNLAYNSGERVPQSGANGNEPQQKREKRKAEKSSVGRSIVGMATSAEMVRLGN